MLGDGEAFDETLERVAAADFESALGRHAGAVEPTAGEGGDEIDDEAVAPEQRERPQAFRQIASRRGQATAIAFVTSIVSPGQIYMGMHSPEVNRLTFPSFDPHSRQPGYKACAVTIKIS